MNSTGGVRSIPSAQMHVTMQLVNLDIVASDWGRGPPFRAYERPLSVLWEVKVKSTEHNNDRGQ